MVNARPTVERRQLGLALKRLREDAGRSQLETGQRIGKDDSRISKIEDGFATLSAEDLETLLDFLSVDGDERETIQALGVEARKRQPRRAYIDLLPGSFQRFADLESAATKIYCYESGVIPGLLQCPGYVNALFSAADSVWWEPSDIIRQNRANFRFQRQETTWKSKKRKELHFIIGESALTDITGSREVMKEQYSYLLDVMDNRDDATVQVLPGRVPDNPARGGGLTVLEFGISVPRIGFASVVVGPSTYYDDGEDTTSMLRTIQRLSDISLSPEESRKDVASKLERLQDDARSDS